MKLLKFLLPIIIFAFFSSSSFAEEKKKDCSKIDTGTGVGMYEKWKCDGGAKGFSKKIKNLFKKKDKN